MCRFSILFVLFFCCCVTECCKPNSFNYLKFVEKMIKATPKTNKWKEASVHITYTMQQYPLIIANEELPTCRINIAEYEKGLKNADTIEVHLHNIPVLLKGDIGNLGITKLYLQDNNIHQIATEAFEHLTWIEEIKLADNYIKVIPAKAFASVATLKVIDLTNNEIDTIDAEAFEKLDNLKELSLASNKLIKWESKWFKNVPNLKHLDVSGNKLVNIEPNSFVGFKSSLEEINLSHNRITNIDAGAFAGTKSLKLLDLNGNELKCLREATLNEFQSDLRLRIIDNKDIDCACLIKIQKYALRTHHIHEESIRDVDKYLQVICIEEIMKKL